MYVTRATQNGISGNLLDFITDVLLFKNQKITLNCQFSRGLILRKEYLNNQFLDCCFLFSLK